MFIIIYLIPLVATVNSFNIDKNQKSLQLYQTGVKAESNARHCNWTNVINIKTCVIRCESGNIDSIALEIDIIYRERMNCANKLRLILNQPILPNNIMSINWLKVKSDVIINSLDIYADNITNYQTDSFQSQTFKSITILRLFNVAANTFVLGLFNGLSALVELFIRGIALETIQYNILKPVSRTLSILNVKQAPRIYNVYPEVYTGGDRLLVLKTVDFGNNCFLDTITNKSFTSLVAVETLKLSNSRIQIIGKGTFDPIASTIKEIDLSGNLLTNLPAEIFANFFPNNNNLIVNLNNNRWGCYCELQPLKDIIILYENNFSDNITCYRPILGQKLIDITLCELTTISTIDTTTATPTTTISSSTEQFTTSTTKRVTSTSTTESTIFTPTETSGNKKCYQITDVNRKRSIQLMQTLQYIKIIDIYDDVNILFELGGDLENYTLLWFTNSNNENPLNEYFDVHKHLKCQSNLSKQILMKNFQHNSVYIFCLMNKYLTTILPSNCVSHKFKNSNYDENIWLWDSDKILTISLIIIGVIASFLITFFIGSRIGWYLYDKEINHQFLENDNINCNNNVNDHSNVVSVEQQHVGSIEFSINDLPPPYTSYECSGKTNNEIYEIAIKPSQCDDDTVDNSDEGIKVKSVECQKIEEQEISSAINYCNLEVVPTTTAPIPLNPQPNENASSAKEQLQLNTLISETNTIKYATLKQPSVVEILEEDPVYSTISA